MNVYYWLGYHFSAWWQSVFRLREFIGADVQMAGNSRDESPELLDHRLPPECDRRSIFDAETLSDIPLLGCSYPS